VDVKITWTGTFGIDNIISNLDGDAFDDCDEDDWDEDWDEEEEDEEGEDEDAALDLDGGVYVWLTPDDRVFYVGTAHRQTFRQRLRQEIDEDEPVWEDWEQEYPEYGPKYLVGTLEVPEGQDNTQGLVYDVGTLLIFDALAHGNPLANVQKTEQATRKRGGDITIHNRFPAELEVPLSEVVRSSG